MFPSGTRPFIELIFEHDRRHDTGTRDGDLVLEFFNIHIGFKVTQGDRDVPLIFGGQ